MKRIIKRVKNQKSNYRWMIGVLDIRTGDKIFDAKNLNSEQAEVSFKEIFKKLR